MKPPHVLVIDDEPSIVDNILYALEMESMSHQCASTLEDARGKLKVSDFDVIVLDVGLPDGNGFEFCKEVRRNSDIPVLFLTARSDEVDRIVGLEIGGDDYIVKPFSPRELVARIKVILRRANRAQNDQESASSSNEVIKGFSIDEWRKCISCANTVLPLSLYEYRILKTFLEAPGRVFSRDQLMDAAWHDPAASVDRAVDTHIKNLRRKLEPYFPNNEIIQTHRGLGYSFSETLR